MTNPQVIYVPIQKVTPLIPGVLLQHFPNGQIKSKATTYGGFLHGAYTEWHPNGQIYMKVNYVNGLMCGPCETYHPNGQVERKLYFNAAGELEGPYAIYYPDGTSHTHTFFHAGQFHGSYRTFYPDGSLEVSILYEHGKAVGKKVLIENGVAEVYDASF